MEGSTSEPGGTTDRVTSAHYIDLYFATSYIIVDCAVLICPWMIDEAKKRQIARSTSRTTRFRQYVWAAFKVWEIAGCAHCP